MKNCGYCGREAEDQASNCPACGTKFLDLKQKEPEDPKPSFREFFSMLACFVSTVAALVSILWVCLSYKIVTSEGSDSRGEGAGFVLLFLLLVAFWLAVASVITLVLSGVFFFRRRKRRDLWTLWASGVTLSIIAIAFIAFWIRSVRNPW